MEKDIREIKKEEAEKKSPLKKFCDYTVSGAKFFGKKASELGKKAWDNKEKIGGGIAATTATVLLIKKTTDELGITHKTHYERTVDQRRTQYYDPSSRRYLELRREPYQYELIEIEERRRQGEPLALILSDMGLLKRNW